jgi:hypothetical protein
LTSVVDSEVFEALSLGELVEPEESDDSGFRLSVMYQPEPLKIMPLG